MFTSVKLGGASTSIKIEALNTYSVKILKNLFRSKYIDQFFPVGSAIMLDSKQSVPGVTDQASCVKKFYAG